MHAVINGVRYHVEKTGEGFPLLLLHGFTGDTTTWDPFIDAWGGHSNLLIPDIIGHGDTDITGNLERYRMESAAKDLNCLLDQLDIRQADVLGYSMGGRLALSFSILYPERVRKLILESSSPGLAGEMEREKRRENDKKLADFLMEKGIKSFVDYWESIPLFSSMKRLPKETQNTIRCQRLRNSPNGLAYSLLGMGTGSQPSWWDNLSRIENEVLLLTGEEDIKFCTIAIEMQKKLKNCTWIAFENTGHAIHVEEPEKFGTIVSDFLSNKN